MEVPRLGTKSELQLPATATATWDPSCVFDLCCSLPKRWILNPLSEARDRTHNLMGTSWVCYCWATTGTPHRAPFLCSCHTMEMWHSTPPVSPQDSHSASPSSPSQHPSLSSPRPFPSNLLVSSSALFQILLSAPGALISVRKLFQMEVIPSEFGCQQNHLMPAGPVETELSSWRGEVRAEQHHHQQRHGGVLIIPLWRIWGSAVAHMVDQRIWLTSLGIPPK